MTEQPLSLKAMSAEDAARVAPRLGLRVIAAVILLELLLLLSFTLAFPGVARAEPLRADISVNLSNGFARIVLRFNDEIDADVKMSNGILVVSFKQPVAVGVERLYSNAVGYVSAARRDPDGKAIRMALSQKVTVNSMMAGERLFIDLMPEGWKGMPPGLPQEIVEELATRAREAEKKARQQRAVTQQRPVPWVKVRVSHQPTFSRYVFELPDLISIGTERGKDGLKLVFEQPLKFDLADVKATLPPTVEAIGSETGEQQTSVSFTFIGKVDIRSFREDNNYVVDISPVGGKPERVDLLPSVPTPVPAASAAQAKPAVVAAVEPPQPSPAQTPSPPPSPPQAAPKAAEAPPPPPQAVTPATSPPAAKPAPERAAMPPAETPAAKPERVVDEGGADQPRAPRDANAPVQVELRRQSDNLKLTFPFTAPTPAACSAAPIRCGSCSTAPPRSISRC